MNNYIVIISVITIIIVFIILYLNDYIKDIYFGDGILDFGDTYSIISKSNNDMYRFFEKYENNEEVATKDELTLNVEEEKYRRRILDVYENINDPIGDEYLPYTVKDYKDDPTAMSNNNINEYIIINIYKNILDRQPTDVELKKHLQDFYENNMNEDILKLRIYNSTEYKMITNMQSNDIKPELIANVSKVQLNERLKKMYKIQHNTELSNVKLIDILIKCYKHLQFNDYLFKAMLMHDKYKEFENNAKNEYILTDERLLDIFNQSFILYELRLIANELKRQDIIKRKALLLPVSLDNRMHSELNSSNMNIDTSKYISDIMKNSDNIFNINIMLNDQNDKQGMPYAKNMRRRVPCKNRIANNSNLFLSNSNVYYANNSNVSYSNNSNVSYSNNSNESFTNNSNIVNGTTSSNNNVGNAGNAGNAGNLGNAVNSGNAGNIDNNEVCYEEVSYDSGYNDSGGSYGGRGRQYNDYEAQKLSNRIYNPIDYKQHYRGDMRYRPNVCSYGTKQIVQPIFLNSSTLFQGTDLKEAAENTQVGSIMPKFEYYEYEDPL